MSLIPAFWSQKYIYWHNLETRKQNKWICSTSCYDVKVSNQVKLFQLVLDVWNFIFNKTRNNWKLFARNIYILYLLYWLIFMNETFWITHSEGGGNESLLINLSELSDKSAGFGPPFIKDNAINLPAAWMLVGQKSL